ncbi:MAG: Eco57I restriction-modification methylase domain-containing protein [Bacteroidales bacterium]|nr:Eco57I restriction-modification methylase domain-containing protein [Bacteroidales bacterium]
MNTVNLRRIFQSKFDYQTFCNDIVHSIFGCNDINKRPDQIKVTTEGDKCYFIGRMTDAEGRELGFFYTQMAPGGDVRRKRVGLRKLIAPYVRYEVDAAIAVFDDGTRWRLSYICDMNEGATLPKRFSYVLGDADGQYNTPTHRLGDLSGKLRTLRIADIFDAFSVETLSKEFFLQKKGWLCGDTNFMLNTFSQSTRRSDYLESVLEPLFFGILNTEPAKREQVFSRNGWQQSLVEKWASIPYLNGGLFERDDVDNLRIVLPESIFSNLFAFLASYNFTVDENDPDDAEIGVDPEMLGKIFESLLEDNKAKGAFYTPKEIVRYMCKESLIAHLASKLPDVTDGVVRAFVESHEMQPELEPYRDNLESALREVKICDPAIGSGAFPMGLLNESWRCREALGTQMSRLQLKKEIIENNIYGVDIERGAIDIARLRFWLSIVVDSEKAEPLPNFDYKFMQGNSLIESYGGFDLSRIAGKTVGRPSTSTQYVIGLDSDLSQKNLQRLLREYFSVTDHQKKATMRHAINAEVKTLIRESVGGTPTFLAKLDQLDPSANQDFFLWHTWFKDIFDKGGFDIVIGNPPYINVKNGIRDDVKQIYKTNYKTAIGQFDLFTLFIEMGLSMSKTGVLSLIVPKPIINNENYSVARQLLLNRGLTNIVTGSNIFENAGVESCIVIAKSSKRYLVSEVDEQRNIVNKYSIPVSVAIKLPFSMISTELSDERLPIIEKIQNKKHVLFGEIVDITRGIECGKSDKCITLTPNEYKLIRGQDCIKYSIVPTNLFCIYDRRDISKFKPLNLYLDTKLLIRRVANELISTVDSDNYLCLNTIYCGKIKDNSYKYSYVCAVLNSSLMNYWFRNIFVLTDKLFPYIRKSQLDFIPIAKALPEEQEQIGNIVNQILAKKHSNYSSDTTYLEKEIDKLVYKLYNLTDEEIAVIDD